MPILTGKFLFLGLWFWVLFPLPLYAGGLDLNTASVEELVSLPGIGPNLARRIVEYRQKHGPFRSVEDLVKVKGIGPKKLEALRPYLKVKSASQKSEEGSGGGGEFIYQWVDEKGVLHFTQFPEEIPPEYRTRAKSISFNGRGKTFLDKGSSASPSSPKASRSTDLLGRDFNWYLKEKERLINRIRELKAQIEENRRVMRALHRGASQARRGTRTKYGLKLGEGPILRRWAEYKRLQRINQELEKELAELEYRLHKGLYREAAKAYAPQEVLEFLKKDP